MFLSETEKQERKTHNEDIAKKPEIIKNGILPGDFLLVRLYAYEGDVTDENGIMIPRYKAYESEGGLPKAAIDNAKYTTKGVVLKVGKGEHTDKLYEEGDVIYVPLRASLNSSQYFFNLQRDKPVTGFEGVIRIPSAMVEFNTKEKITYEGGSK